MVDWFDYVDFGRKNLGIMEFNNPNFHQLVGNGPNFKNSNWRSQLLTFCKTLDPC
ncbi:hypothetical protein Hanom_Chr07g00614611 [Helianthus anomalus]